MLFRKRHTIEPSPLNALLDQQREASEKEYNPLDFDKFRYAVYNALKDWSFPAGVEIEISCSAYRAEIKEIGYRADALAMYKTDIGGFKKIILFYKKFCKWMLPKSEHILEKEIQDVVMHELLHFQDHMMRFDIGHLIDCIECERIKRNDEFIRETRNPRKASLKSLSRCVEMIIEIDEQIKELTCFEQELLECGREMFENLMLSGTIPKNMNWKKELAAQLGLKWDAVQNNEVFHR